MHHHFRQARTRRHTPAETDCYGIGQFLFGEVFQFRNQLLNVGAAVRFEEYGQVGDFIVVIDVGVEVARLAGHGIEKQILGNQLLTVRNHIELGIVGIHRLIHTLNEIGNRKRFSHIRLRFGEALRRLNAFQHAGIFNRVGVLALNE